MSDLHILAGVRTPFTKAGTKAARFSADDLGRLVASELIARIGIDPGDIDEVLAGCVGQPPGAQNIARIIALRAGVPHSVPAMTVHRNCASGFEAVTTAAERMASGRGSLFLVVATESMSNYPIRFGDGMGAWLGRFARARSLFAKLGALGKLRMRYLKPHPTILEGLRDPVVKLSMGQTAEVLAKDYDITREEQDAFALESHRRAHAARDALAEEIVPLYATGVEHDNGVREGQTMDALGKLRPVFERGGTVTVGNACQVTDGAVALLVGDPRRFDGEPLARVERYAYAGCDPRRMGLGPVHAIPQVLNGHTLDDMDAIEINEAFAVQVLACQRELHIDPEKLNRQGGAIALGHPVGATGARLLLSLALQLRRNNRKRGLASLCVGGGQGGAVVLSATGD